MNELDYEPSPDLLKDQSHTIALRVDRTNGDVYLECSSRLALSEFARSLLAAATTGSGWEEFFPLGGEGSNLVVNGARFTPDSSRLFVSFPAKQHAA